MATTIRILRFSAKLLVLVTPVMVVTGLLTAKPYLWDVIGFSVARSLHTVAVPFLFLPLVAIHSVAGLLFLLARSKTYNRPVIRRTVLVIWPSLFLALGLLSLVPPPSAIPSSSSPLVAVDGGADAGPDGGGEAQGDSGGLDGGGGADDTGVDRGEVGAESGGNPSEGDAAPPRDSGLVKKASSSQRLRRRRRRARPVSAPPAKQRADQTVEVSKSRPAPVEAAAPPSEPTSPPAEPASAATEPASPPVAAGARLVRQRCGGCHPVSLVYDGPPRSAATWRQVVIRMQQMGAQLTDREAQIVVRHLARR